MTFREMRDAFEAHAKDERLDLTEHPLHALYLVAGTQVAWKAWKAAHVALGAYVPGADPEATRSPA